MNAPSDEMLMAYADDALDATDRGQVDAYLASNPDAQRQVEMFRRTAAATRAAFDAPLHERPPQALIDLLRHGTGSKPDAAEPTARDANVIPIGPRLKRPRLPAQSTFGWPMAASIALFGGLAAGYILALGVGPSSGEILSLGTVPRQSQLARTLEQVPSGKSSGNYTVIATFRDRAERVCREVEFVPGGTVPRPELAGVACRSRDGVWIVEGAVRIAVAAPASGTGYEPSGAAERDALEGLLNVLGAKTALTPAEELALIEKAWR